jgi:hypothetical protein
LSAIASAKAVKSNWFGFDLIFDSEVAETFEFDLILIQFKKQFVFIQTRLSSH